jgi:hypothetical protein
VNLGEAWTFVLELIAQAIIPVWNNLIQYLPLLLLVLVVVSIFGLIFYWQRNSTANRSRVPAQIPSGRMPEDMHLPGPSLWPFVAPVGLVFIAFAVVFGPLESLANMVLTGVGVAIAVIGIVGWYLDAKKEYAVVEAGGHVQIPAEVAPALPGWSLSPPDGMHLPGPSAWPFLAPVGLLFMVAGLIFGPVLLVSGLVMAVIAIIGWLFDAEHEYDDVAEHGHPTQADRDPEKAWPRRLIPVYFFLGGLALLITLMPWLLSLLPGSG